jgi:hypothetical protein
MWDSRLPAQKDSRKGDPDTSLDFNPYKLWHADCYSKYDGNHVRFDLERMKISPVLDVIRDYMPFSVCDKFSRLTRFKRPLSAKLESSGLAE